MASCIVRFALRNIPPFLAIAPFELGRYKQVSHNGVLDPLFTRISVSAS